MLDYFRNMQLALTDTVRRTAMKAGAGVVMVIGAGFLMAALWTFLAHELGWGSMYASLTIGGVFVLIAIVVILMAGKPRHTAPKPEELGKEISARLNMAADTAIDKVKTGARETLDSAEKGVSRMIDKVGATANRFADDTEARVQGFARGTVAPAARSIGLTEENYEAAREQIHRATQHKAAPAVGLIGAFATGLAIASKLQDWRQRDDDLFYADEEYFLTDEDGIDDYEFYESFDRR
ncbi:MAG: phage holin family protein [Paracoccus sp. (in: a-proteobacteria)]|nr:phage holin family protein [Paracoccus sp. (in: a-proteobacteria)]